MSGVIVSTCCFGASVCTGMFGDYEVIERLESYKYEVVALTDVVLLTWPRALFSFLVHPVVPVGCMPFTELRFLACCR